ncbi:hypothetical protein Hanom_Chr00s030382g01769731 [Helianthus anomalus]
MVIIFYTELPFTINAQKFRRNRRGSYRSLKPVGKPRRPSDRRIINRTAGFSLSLSVSFSLSVSLSLSLCLLQPSLTITRHHHSQVNYHSRRLWWCCCRPLPLNSIVGKHRRRLRRSSNLSQRRSENRGVGVRVYRCGCGSPELRSEPVRRRKEHRRGRGDREVFGFCLKHNRDQRRVVSSG